MKQVIKLNTLTLLRMLIVLLLFQQLQILLPKLLMVLADDVLSSAFLAATCPKIIAPAMNVHMYENTATQKNLDICKSYHIRLWNLKLVNSHVVIKEEDI